MSTNQEAETTATNGTDKPSILVIDGDEVIRELIEYNLSAEYHIDACSSAEDAIELDIASYSLILLDINLGGSIDGFQLTEMLARNKATAAVPFIFCTARDSEDEIIAGFDAGADDYIVKPFSLREMVARVKSVIRRHAMMRPSATTRPTNLQYEGLVLKLENQRVEFDGQPVSMSRTEYQILKLFMKNPGKLFTRDEIHRMAWPDEDAVSARTIDVNLSRIRKKIGPYATSIISKPGLGYGLMSREL